jgi:hypothetical protein
MGEINVCIFFGLDVVLEQLWALIGSGYASISIFINNG